MKLQERLRRPRGEGAASLAAMSRESEGTRNLGMGHLEVGSSCVDRSACFADHALRFTDFDRGCHGGGLLCFHTIRPPGGKPGGRWSASELDRFGSRCADRLIVGSTVSDVLSGHVFYDRLQDLQELGTVSGTVQEGGCQVAGHARIAG